MSSITVAVVSAAAIGDRSEQQDHHEYGTFTHGAWAVVCDGMGGRPDGERCADLATASAAEYLGLASGLLRRFRLADYLMRLPLYVQRSLARQASAGALDAGAATTLAAAVVLGGVGWLVSFGDCRCTVLRDGIVYATTSPDNRLTEALRDEREPALSPRIELASVVTRSLGARVPGPDGRTTVTAVPLRAGDLVVLTSDGVHQALGLGGMVEHLADPDSAVGHDRTAAELVAAATAAAAPTADNATAVMMRVGEAR